MSARLVHLPVRRTARLALLGEPTPAIRQVWIACHGYAQLAPRFLRRFEPIAGPTRLIVAPEGLNRFYLEGAAKAAGPDAPVGATWMTSEDREIDIDDYVGYLDTVHDHLFERLDRDAVRLVALGFSQGCATVCRWAARTPARVDRLVLWAGALPPELTPAPDLFGGAALTFVSGREDAFNPEPAMAALERRLGAVGLACERRTFDGGHRLDAATLAALAAELEERVA